MKKIAFLCAIKEEEDAIIDEFKDCESKTEEVNGSKFRIIQTKNAEVIIGFCGCGKVNAGINTAITIMSFKPDMVVNCGVAGGFSKSQKVLDLVVGTSFLYHDVDIECLGFKPGQLLGEPDRFPADAKLVALMKDIEKESKFDFNVHYGTIASGDQFIHRDDQVQRILNSFPETICVEMEGAAVAHTCMKFKVPCLAIRSLSDIAVSDHDNSVDFVVACKAAASRAALLARKLVLKL